jgi:hypothetical protein
LSAYTIKNLSADTINNLSADTIKNLSAYTINNLSAYTIKNLSADTINNLSAYTIKKLQPNLIEGYEKFWASIPKIEKPYSTLLADIKAKRRCYNQADWGDIKEYDATQNVCETAMCVAGHLTHMLGPRGYELLKEFGGSYSQVGEIAHRKAHPNYPVMNFGNGDQKLGMAFIETMAEIESKEEGAK